MDKIYSRKRIKIPKVEGFRFQRENPKTKKNVKLTLIIIVAILTAFLVIRFLNPVFNTLCLEKAKGIATEILNTESSKILKDVDYGELVSILRDSNRTNNNVKN